MMNNKVRKTKRGRLVATVAAVALLAVACGIGIRAYAQSTSAPKPVNGTSKVDTQSTQSAPQTDSQTVSDADERLADSLKNALSTSSEGLTEVTHPDGTVTVDLEGRFQNFSVAKVNPDGTITTECVSDAKEVDQFFGTGDAKTAAKPTANDRTVKPIESTPKARRKN